MVKMKFALCYRQRYRAAEENMSIHRAGCADLQRGEKIDHDAHVTVIEAESAESARDGVMLDDELREMGYGVEHVKIYPCCSAAGKK